MRIYKDKELNEQIDASTLDLGIGLAGESHEYTFYVHNNLNAELKNLKFEIKPVVDKAFEQRIAKEVKILEAPQNMDAKSVSPLKLQWNPAVDIKSGLKAQLQVNGFEIWS